MKTVGLLEENATYQDDQIVNGFQTQWQANGMKKRNLISKAIK